MPWENDEWVGPPPTVEEIAADYDEPLGCDCCDSLDVLFSVVAASKLSNWYQNSYSGGSPPFNVICDLCLQSGTAALDEDPGSNQSSLVILKTICFVGNEILKAIRAGQASPPARPEVVREPIDVEAYAWV